MDTFTNNNNNQNNNNNNDMDQSESNKKSVDSTTSINSNSTDECEECIVCFKDVNIYSIGECDHPVCYECSTRMRVLCQQNECPICRHNLGKVIFTMEKLPYRELETRNRSEYYNRRYKIGFSNADIEKGFYNLLDHPCPNCNTLPYRTFQALKNHVQRKHDLYYCDICTKHLKIFTFERRCYTKAELAIHRRKGDADNKSHRGHPLCEYCNQRHLDQYELFRHLRREHYFCHFCDADGINAFYGDYDALADHFRRDHYLCEEGRCAAEQFIGAFRTEIDYKAHVANVHGKNLTKQQAKQTRTLQLEITLGPRSRAGQNEVNPANLRSRGNEPEEETLTTTSQSTAINQRTVTIDADNEQEFPSLAGSAAGPSMSLAPPPPQSLRMHGTRAGLARTKENFPALGETRGGGVPSAASSVGGSAQNKTIPISSIIKKATNTTNTGARPRTTATASINGNATGMVIHVSNRPSTSSGNPGIGGGINSTKNSTVDFPALPTTKSTKKQTKFVDPDEVLPTSPIPLTPISAKHRTLVDDYVSAANPSNFQKIQLVQKDTTEPKSKKLEEGNAPKLTPDEFPSLAPASPTTNNASGPRAKLATVKKPREVESRKSKVAPAPVLPKPKDNNSTSDVSNKKEKDKKKKSSPDIVNSQAAKANSNNKQKEKDKEKNNNENKTKNSNINNEVLTNGITEYTVNSRETLRPPPGFDSQNPVKPPPGFHSDVTVNSVAKLPNNLTFTTSLGQSYNIVPTHFAYIPPQDATKRNQKLVSYFKETLDNPEALEEFRSITQNFREGFYKAPAYYEHCKAALKHNFDKVFPELLVLLPDIGKQQALYLVYSQYLYTMDSNKRKLLPKLEVCSICKQILLSSDMAYHQKVHNHAINFPSIDGANKSKTFIDKRKS